MDLFRRTSSLFLLLVFSILVVHDALPHEHNETHVRGSESAVLDEAGCNRTHILRTTERSLAYILLLFLEGHDHAGDDDIDYLSVGIEKPLQKKAQFTALLLDMVLPPASLRQTAGHHSFVYQPVDFKPADPIPLLRAPPFPG